jgi:hypothetical protein
VVNAFKKNYWGYVDNEVECGPLVFNAIADYPRLDLIFENFPEVACEGQCEQISAKIVNTGRSQLRGFVLVLNSPHSFACDWPNITRLAECMLIEYHEPVPVGVTVSISLILRAGESGTQTFRSFVAVMGIRCAFAVKTLSTHSVARFEARPAAIKNQTSNLACHFTVTSDIAGLGVIGLINGRHRKLVTVGVNPGDRLAAGQSVAFLAFIADETDEEVEPWRAALLDTSKFALLLSVPGVALPIQKNLSIRQPSPRYQLILTMPSRVEVALGTVLSCAVELRNPQSDDLAVWLEPLPFKFSERTDRTAESGGCRWIGVTRRQLCKQNGFRAEFKFGAFGSGIFHAPGFFVASKQDFPSRAEILLSQLIQIILK